MKKRWIALLLLLALLPLPGAGEDLPEVWVLEAPEEFQGSWQARIYASAAGTLTLQADGSDAAFFTVEAGEQIIEWDGTVQGTPLGSGTHEVRLRLQDGAGNLSAVESLDVSCSGPRGAHDLYSVTPNTQSGTACDHADCYWNLEMGCLDETAVWRVLMQPITVISGSQRHQTKIRREPDKDCKSYTGEVTEESQGVHILRQEGDWTEIQAYSSSVEGSAVGVWAAPFTGWVETEKLKEITPDASLGIVIDKLSQRLLVYREGRLYATLLCSTGFPRAETPFNETPAGEYLMVSRTGGFWSNEMFCDYGLRINDGILLHEVPALMVTEEDGSTKKDHSRFEPYLGEKASHGCIRIQRYPTPEGVNMRWLWDNVKVNTKVLLWDEVGRELTAGDDDLVLYYNPNNGRNFHSDPQCAGVNQKFWPLTPFRYGDFSEEPYSRLKRCPYCSPALSPTEVVTANEKNTRSY